MRLIASISLRILSISSCETVADPANTCPVQDVPVTAIRQRSLFELRDQEVFGLLPGAVLARVPVPELVRGERQSNIGLEEAQLVVARDGREPYSR
jgi:hypothetical protein